MSTEAVLFDLVDGIATLTLNEVEKMNALSIVLRRRCLDLIRQVQHDESIRVLVITANGKGFCVGADLSEFEIPLSDIETDADARAAMGSYVDSLMRDFATPIVEALRTLPIPVICAVDGAVAGGGVGFSLAADIVIATRASYFFLPFAPVLGLIPDMGASWFLPRAVGRARALG